jgi:hypothetical protein
MKNINVSIKLSLFITFIFLSQNALSQCNLGNNVSDLSIPPTLAQVLGQSFTAECNGFLEYVQVESSSIGTVSAGTLNIYDGNTVSAAPIYTQAHPSITVSVIGDPIRVNITGSVPMVLNNQYTFAFVIDNVMYRIDAFNPYPGGHLWDNGLAFTEQDQSFGVSITSTLSSNDNYVFRKDINIYPNPSHDFISISNLKTIEAFSIINALGQEITTGKIKSDETIDIKNLKNGLYFLRLNNGNTLQFIKN